MTKREKIISVAQQLFSEQGFYETSIAEIAKAANASTATIYKYFGNKEKLFDSINQPELLGVRPAYEAKKQQIIQTALSLFGQKGYEGTSIEDIAFQCGFTKGNFYQFFNTKEELFAEVIRQGKVLPFLQIVHNHDDDLRETLAKLAFAFLDTLTETERLNLLRLTIADSPKFPEAGANLYHSAINKANSLLADFLKKLQDNKQLSEADPKFTARLFFGVLLSFVVVDHLIYPGHPEYSREEIVQNTVSFFIKALNVNKLGGESDEE